MRDHMREHSIPLLDTCGAQGILGTIAKGCRRAFRSISCWLEACCDESFCVDLFNNNPTKCTCLHDAKAQLDQQGKAIVVEYLVDYAMKKPTAKRMTVIAPSIS